VLVVLTNIPTDLIFIICAFKSGHLSKFFKIKRAQSCGVDTRGKKKKGTSKKNMDGRCMSSHENKTFRSRSVVKQKGMVFGFRKTVTDVTRPER
jgi:hypothetical protein